MEFCEKLQELRKSRGLTQEELAEKLYVSRTAISKWESGRGFPSIDSVRAISKFFSVSLDELFSDDAILTVAKADSAEKERRTRTLVFGLLDCCTALLLLLPLCFRASRSMHRGFLYAVQTALCGCICFCAPDYKDGASLKTSMIRNVSLP